ncbi:MAG: 50S ribosomal protein L13 [Nanoarchaeota archaeon]|nr:50S ribosomal protein L13 [Nanoarchaeota archaeon]
MKIIDAKDAIMGRLAAYVAKQAMNGEDVVVVNCEQAKITGRRLDIVEDFLSKRKTGGVVAAPTNTSRVAFKIVKRTIRGMLPDYRMGRGRVAFKKIKCYNGVPKEFESAEKITLIRPDKKGKFIRVSELSKI